VVSVRTSAWYAIRVKSNREHLAAQGLKGKGFEVCVPLYSARFGRTSDLRRSELPLFPGYIFCRFDPLNRLPILTVPGVVHIVSFGKIPQPVEDEEITAVLTVLRSGLQVTPYPALPVGQRVLLEGGPLAGLSGVILAHRKKEKFVVSISLLQRSVAVLVDRSWLSLVRPESSVRHIA
jgi:transcriptional antiterminator NusG